MTRLRASLASHPATQGIELRYLAVLVVVLLPLCFAVFNSNPSLLLATFVAATLVLVTLRDLSLGVLAVAASVPIQAVASLNIEIADITWTQLAVLATISAWGLRIVWGTSRPRLDGIGTALSCYVV